MSVSIIESIELPKSSKACEQQFILPHRKQVTLTPCLCMLFLSGKHVFGNVNTENQCIVSNITYLDSLFVVS